MAARGHLSLRPTNATLGSLERRARRSGEPKTSLAERYLREGLEMDEFPGVYFTGGALGRRPALLGTGLDVWEIIETVQNHEGSIEDAASYLEVDPTIVARAVRYYGAHRDEIDAWIARVHEIADAEERKWRAAQAALSGTPPSAASS
jgi:uncharacterized protein (DUF433 family)